MPPSSAASPSATCAPRSWRTSPTAVESLARPNPTQLSEAECLAWLGALNDLRLTLGTRLEISEDGPEEFLALADDDPRRAMYLVYDWLTYHQDRLVQALQKGIRA